MVKSQETGGTRREEDQNNVVSGNDNQPDLSEQENQTNDVAMEPVTKKSELFSHFCFSFQNPLHTGSFKKLSKFI